MSTYFRPYPAYKPSGVEWLGDVPAHWEVSSLRRNLREGNEGIKIGPFGSQLKLEDMQDSGWKVYGQENVIAQDFKIGNKYISDAKFKELATCAVHPGDLVVSMMGTTGRCCVVPPETEPGLINSHLIRLRVQNNKLLPEYAALLIDEAHYVREQINAAGKGAIMQGLNSSIVKELTLVIPSVIEQRTIAASLDRETARLDALIAKHERLIELLQEKRAALISHVVTQGLDPSAPMNDSGVPWLGQIPAHWEIKRLGAVAPLLRGHDLTTAEWQDGDVPVISSSGLSGYHNQAKAKGPAVPAS